MCGEVKEAFEHARSIAEATDLHGLHGSDGASTLGAAGWNSYPHSTGATENRREPDGLDALCVGWGRAGLAGRRTGGAASPNHKRTRQLDVRL